MVLTKLKVFPFILFLFLFQKGDFIMLLSDLLQVINASNLICIMEMTEPCNDYELIYLGRIETRSEQKRIIEKYGDRKIKEIDTKINLGKYIYIELER